MEESLRKIAEWVVISAIGFVCKYIMDMKKSLDAAHEKIRKLQSKVGDES